MMVLDILIPVLILTGIAVLFGILIAVCSIKFQVKTDERIEEIEMLLSGANCGACGYAGCADFARALVEGTAQISSCNSTSKDNKKKILGFLDGGEVGEETIVVCACVGGNACKDKYDYQGYGDCASQELLSGGRKACYTGCIGMSRCVNLCPSHAIDIKKGVAIINQDKCTQCGVCILQCPKKIMKRIPATAKYYVLLALPKKRVKTFVPYANAVVWVVVYAPKIALVLQSQCATIFPSSITPSAPIVAYVLLNVLLSVFLNVSLRRFWKKVNLLVNRPRILATYLGKVYPS